MSVEFDGVNATIDVGDPSHLQNVFASGGTICAWINIDGYGEASFGRVADKDGLSGVGWAFFVNNATATNTFEFAKMFSTVNGQWAAPNSSLTTGTWYHVGIAYDSDSVLNLPDIYLDGTAQTRVVQSVPVGSSSSDVGTAMNIGNDDSWQRCFDGKIADVRLYNRKLTAAEFSTIHASKGHDTIFNDLVGRWMLNDGAPGDTASTANDFSNYKQNATGANTPVFREDALSFKRRLK